MSDRATFFFDFDSTVLSVESLDEIIKLSIDEMTVSAGEKSAMMHEVEQITDCGMNGEIDLGESIRRRIAVAKVHERHIDTFCRRMASEELLTVGMRQLIRRLRGDGHEVFIISGGLSSVLRAAADIFSLPVFSVFGNEYRTDADGFVIGVDAENPLTTMDGKAAIIRSLKKSGKAAGLTTLVGDGMSDVRPYEQGAVDRFIGFGVHKVRPAVERRTREYVRSIAELSDLLFPSPYGQNALV